MVSFWVSLSFRPPIYTVFAETSAINHACASNRTPGHDPCLISRQNNTISLTSMGRVILSLPLHLKRSHLPMSPFQHTLILRLRRRHLIRIPSRETIIDFAIQSASEGFADALFTVSGAFLLLRDHGWDMIALTCIPFAAAFKFSNVLSLRAEDVGEYCCSSNATVDGGPPARDG